MGKYLEFRWDTDEGIHIDHEYRFEDTDDVSYETLKAFAAAFYEAIFTSSTIDKKYEF